MSRPTRQEVIDAARTVLKFCENGLCEDENGDPCPFIDNEICGIRCPESWHGKVFGQDD